MKLTSLTLSLLLAGMTFATHSQKREKPNIVLIMSDDQGIGDVSSFYSKGKIKPPHIDRLSCEGTLGNHQLYAGNYLDSFDNKITMHAYANPEENNRAEGYGVVAF